MEIRDQPPADPLAPSHLPGSAMSYAGLLEKIEILRARLRWAQHLERADIERLLHQAGTLRDDVLQLSHRERFVQAAQLAPTWSRNGASAAQDGTDDPGSAATRSGHAPASASAIAAAASATDAAAVRPMAAPGATAAIAATTPTTAITATAAPAASRRQALLARSFVFEGTFGDNPRLLEALEIAEKAAPTRLPVLIDGESGTGKELMAKVIHANGSRSTRPFISVNCGAIPENLIESELFGHRKGAFTGAATDRKGKFESADGGTIFLDEIGELPLQGQVKLLRVLESQEIQRVGADEPIQVDVRIVAATNRNLRQMAAEGSFREDLFYRLDVIRVTLPPLRERRDEIPLLLAYFGDEAAEALGRRPVAMTPALRRFLLDYAYPGNIRELRNLVYRLACLADDAADVRHLPPDLRNGVGSAGTPAGSAGWLPAAAATDAGMPASPLQTRHAAEAPASMPAGPAPRSLGEARRVAGDAAERAFLERGLQDAGGTVTELARRCAMNRSHLQALLKKHGLHARDFRAAAGRAAAAG